MNSRLRILHLEDDLNDSELVRSALEEDNVSLDIDRVETKIDFVEALGDKEFDIVLADYRLPSFDGLSALAIVREKTPDLPFVFVSGVMGEELAIETLKSGATDYVLKQHLSRLAPAVHRALKESEERIERRKAKDEMKERNESRDIEQRK
ncbi:MAG TPA: response regulator [Thermodesulfovibrionales bacterium]|nr:response regulator [Thermodesulfovibrionales bacterium]